MGARRVHRGAADHLESLSRLGTLGLCLLAGVASGRHGHDAHSVEKAIARTGDAETLCGQSSAKKAKKRLQQGGTALTQYTHRLTGLPARRKLDGLAQPFIDEGAPILRDVATLRGALHCPDDAAST